MSERSPLLSELEQIGYLLEQVPLLERRGLLTAEAAATIRREYAERRAQLARAAERETRRTRAVEWERTSPARAVMEYEALLAEDPAQPDLYRHLVQLYQRLNQPAEALRVCEAGAVYDEELGRLATELREREEHRQRLRALQAALRQACEAGEAPAILAACQALLGEEPTHLVALETQARVYAQQGEWERAIASYQDLIEIHPQHPARGGWTRERNACQRRRAAQRAAEQQRLGQEETARRAEDQARRRERAARYAVERPVRPGWIQVIVREHPGDIIIGLGILAVIVAGAIWGTLQREQAWAMYLPALMITGAIFGFGYYLMVRADRRSAGEMLFIGTAVLIPVNALLLGELHLLQLNRPLDLTIGIAGLLFLALLAVLIAGHWERQGIHLFGPAFLLLSVLEAGLDRDRPLGNGVLLAVLYLAGVVLAAGVVNVNLRLQAPTRVGRREFLGFGLGLMLYATALLALRLHTWFGVPLIHYAPLSVLAAMAVFHTAHCSPRLLGEPKMSQLFPLGYALLGLGCAIALVQHAQSAPLLFATTALAAATCSLLVWQYHQPFHLYAAFVTGGVAYLVWPLVWTDFAAWLNRFTSQLLGFQGEPLPPAFGGLRLFWASFFLLLLALHFERRREPRLVTPCHLVGVPLSVAALGLALGHPQAMCLTCLGTAALYAVAAVRWRRPVLVYLAAGLASGSLYAFGVWQGWSTPVQSLALALLAVGWLALSAEMRSPAREDYAKPLWVVALGLSIVPLVFGCTTGEGLPSLLALGLVAGLYLWSAWLMEAAPLSYLGLATVAIAGYGAVTGLGLEVGRPGLGLLALSLAWLYYLGGEILLGRPVARGAELTPEGSSASGRTLGADGVPPRSLPDYRRLYAWPLVHTSLALAVLGLTALERPPDLPLAVSLVLACALAATATRVYPTPLLTYLAALIGVALVVVVYDAAIAIPLLVRSTAPLPPGPDPLPFAVLALVLYGISAAGRWRYQARAPDTWPGWDHLYRRPLVHTALALSLITLAACGYWWRHPSLTALACALTTLLYWLATSLYPAPVLAYAALAAGAAAVTQVAAALGLLPSAPAGALLAALIALALWGLGLWCRHGAAKQAESHPPSADSARRPVFAEPCLISALVVSIATLSLSATAAVSYPDGAAFGIAALLLTALLYVLATFVEHEAILTHAAIASVAAAVGWAGWPLERLAFATSRWEVLAVTGLALAVTAWVIAGMVRRSEMGEEFQVQEGGRPDSPPFPRRSWRLGGVSVVTSDLERLYVTPLYLDALLLALAALALGYGNAAVLGLLALAALLPLGSHPSAHWLYATLLLGLAATALALGRSQPAALQNVTPVCLALGLWLAGTLLMHFRAPFARALRLAEQPYEQPLYHVALSLSGVGVVWCLFDLTAGQTWLTLQGARTTVFLLGLFWLLMIKAYPHPAWLYAAVGAVSYGLATVGLGVLRPLTGDPLSAGGLAFLLLGYLWWTGGFILEGAAPRLCRGLGLPEADYAAPLKHVSLLTAGAVALGLMIVSVGSAAVEWQGGGPLRETLGLSWASVAIGFALAWVYLLMMFRLQPGGEFLAAKKAFELCFWWWLACEVAPVGRVLPMSHTTATVVFALLLALLAAVPEVVEELHQVLVRPSGRTAFPLADFRRILEGSVLTGGALALLLTGGRLRPETIVTLFLAASVFSLAAVTQRRPGLLYVGGGTLQAGLFYLLFWRAMETTQGGAPGILGEMASSVAAFATVPMMALAWVAAAVEARSGEEGRPYAPPLRHLAWGLAAIAAMAVAGAWMHLEYPPAGRHIVLCGLSLGLLAAFLFWQAAREQVEWPVYPGLLALASGWFWARLAAGLPGRFDPWAMVVVGLAFHGAGQMLKRMPVFSRPLLVASLALPLVPLGLLVLQGYTPTDQVGVTLTIALFYALIWQQTRWRWAGIAFGLLMQTAFSLYWLHADLSLREHLQYYCIPAGFLALLFAHVHRRELGAGGANAVRWVAGAMIYLSSSADLFRHQIALGHWAALMLLSVLGLLAGYGLRLRVFFWLGSFFFIGNTAALLTHRAVTQPEWRVLILLLVGLTLIVCGSFWSRLWEGWRELNERMEE